MFEAQDSNSRVVNHGTGDLRSFGQFPQLKESNFFDQADQEQQHHGADRGGHDQANQAASGQSQQSEQETAGWV
jgi:hypothetical protein